MAEVQKATMAVAGLQVKKLLTWNALPAALFALTKMMDQSDARRRADQKRRPL
jgi:hypothetical protein